MIPTPAHQTIRLAIRSVFVIPLLLISHPAKAQTVQVLLQSGARVEGNLAESTPTQLTLKIGSSDRAIEVNEIRAVAFRDEPSDLKSGRAAVLGGNYARGLADLQRVHPGELTDPNVKHDLQFLLAYAEGKLVLSRGGDKAAAGDKMLAFVRTAANSYHFFRAAELLGELAVARGDFSDAARYYSTIASRAPWPPLQRQAQLAAAQTLLISGQIDAAQHRFQQVADGTAETKPTIRQTRLAEVGLARCGAANGAPDQAIQRLEALIKAEDSSDAELFGRIYNALGASQVAAGRPTEALLAYLHVDVLFDTNPEIHAETLHQLAKLWQETGQNDRAAATTRLLQQRYAGSYWAAP